MELIVFSLQLDIKRLVVLAFASTCMFCCAMLSTLVASPPSLESIEPPVASRGATVELRATGSSLTGCDQVLFYREGIECIGLQSSSDESLVLQLRIAPDCPLGPHPVRIQSSSGLSELRTIVVSPFPVLMGTKQAEPLLVEPNTTYVGALSGSDTDRFRIHCRQGEILSGEVVAVRLGTKLLDTEITVMHPDGSIACLVDDTPLLNQDPCFTFRAQQTGEYVVELRAVGSNADSGSPYAIHLGNFPRPSYLFPAGGQAGSQIALQIFGIHPDEPPVETIELTIPDASSALVPCELERVEADGSRRSCPSPIMIRAANFETATDEITHREPPVAPTAFHGVIQNNGQLDHHAFRVPENGLWVVEIYAETLGSRLDSSIEIIDTQSGRCVAQSDDFDSHDSRAVFAGHSGRTYSVQVKDKRTQSSPWHGYRLEIRPLAPKLMSFLPRRDKLSQTGQTVTVPRGNRVLAMMAIQRNRVSGTASLEWKGLPPSIVASSPNWQTDNFAFPVVLEASTAAAETASLVEPLPWTEAMRGKFVQTIDLVRGPADALYCASTVNQLALSVTRPVPYRIELIPPANALPIGGTLDLLVRVEREPGWDAPIEVQLPLLPEFVEAPAKIRIESNESIGRMTLRAHPRAQPQSWPLVVEANIANRNPSEKSMQPGAIDIAPSASTPLDSPAVCSSLRSLDILACPIHAALDSIAAEQGQEIEIACTIDGELDDTGRWNAGLEGLPNRVTSEGFAIEPGERQLRFKIRVAEDAPIGTFPDLQIRLTGELKEQPISYCIAGKTKLVISPPGKSKRDEQGRLLSPLEALRRQRSSKSL